MIIYHNGMAICFKHGMYEIPALPITPFCNLKAAKKYVDDFRTKNNPALVTPAVLKRYATT